jgi:DHA2 family multidrug resistance protein
LTTFIAGRFGRTRLYVFSAAAFTAASMLCGLAQTLPQIVLFRVLQGFLGGALLPLSQAVMIDIYPPEKRTFGMSLFTLGVLFGPIMGPTIGGFLTDLYNWRWCFFINLPFGTICAVGLALTLPETPRQRTQTFDAMGFAFLALAVGTLQVMLDRGETQDWFSSSEIDVEAILTCTGFYLFTVHTLTTERPFIGRAVFRDVNFVVGTVVGSLIVASTYAITALVPLMLQSLMDYPPKTAGLVMSWRGLGSAISMVIVNRFSHYGIRRMVVLGILVTAIGSWYMAGFTIDVANWEVGLACALMGFGLSMAWTPLTVMSFATLDATLTTEAASVGSLIRNTFGSIGISTMVSLLANNNQINHQVLSEHITAFSRSLQALAAHTILTPESGTGLLILDSAINREAAMQAYVNDYVVLAWLTLSLVPFVFLLRRGAPTRSAPPSVATEA